MDPRVKTIAKNIQLQYDLSYQCYVARKECMKILDEIRIYRARFAGDQNTPAIKEVTLIENSPQGSTEPSFSRLNNSFASLFNVLQDSDMPPTTQMIANIKEAMKAFNELKMKWEKLKK